MRKTLIVAVLSIGLVTFVSSNTYAGDPLVRRAGERALDLSQPENIARLTGTWEGTWQVISPGSGVPGTVTMMFAYDPKAEEKPFLRRTRTRGSPLADPNKFSTDRGQLEGDKVQFRGTSFDTSFRLFERGDGTLILRGEMLGHSGNFINLIVASVLHKVEGGQQAAQQASQ